jgi:predicted transcriptional regulator
MTFTQTTIVAFIRLLEDSPELFQSRDLHSLMEHLPARIEEISNCLISWCNQDGEMAQALQEVRQTVLDQQPQARGIAGTVPDSESEQEFNQLLQSTLINALRETSTPE